MKRTRAILTAPLLAWALAGCNPNSQLMPYYGKWDGGYMVEELDSPATEKDLQRESLSGYIMLYATGNKFKLYQQGEQQTIEVEGTWKLEGKQVRTQTTKIKIDDMGGEEFRDPNKKYIPSDDVRAAFGKPMVLTLNSAKTELKTPAVGIGNRIGSFTFKRG